VIALIRKSRNGTTGIPLCECHDASALRNLSDESLLAGLGSGDPDATAVFVRWFQRRVFGLTLSILRDHGAAEEAAQELRARMEARFGLRPATRNRGGVAADHRP
jgi:hypothetical protein